MAGDVGSGPAQLSPTVLADERGDRELSQRFCQDLKFKVIARLSGDEFDMSVAEVRQKVAELEAEWGHRRK